MYCEKAAGIMDIAAFINDNQGDQASSQSGDLRKHF